LFGVLPDDIVLDWNYIMEGNSTLPIAPEAVAADKTPLELPDYALGCRSV